MVHAPHLRKLLSIAFVGALAACSSVDTPATRPVLVGPDTATSLSLVPRTGQALMVGNSCTPRAAEGVLQKTVDDAELQALVDTLVVDGSFDYGAPAMPPGANQVLVLVHGERQWFWSPGGSQDRNAAFLRTRSYFLQLFNHARSYEPAASDALRTVERAAARKRKS
ncbi:MAG: hypothetical protein R3F29_14605 [Planctomycetota bacterium]